MTASRGRHGARRLLVQALYQKQVGGHDDQDLRLQYLESTEVDAVDREFFSEMLERAFH